MIDPHPLSIGEVIMSLGCILAIAVSWKALNSKGTTIEPQPLEVKEADKFASKEELLRVESRIEKVEDRMGTKLDALEKSITAGFKAAEDKRENSVSGVYKTFEDRLAKLSDIDRMTGERLAGIEQQNKDLSNRLDDMKNELTSQGSKLDIILQRLPK